MAKTFEFEDETRGDISKEPITAEEADAKNIQISSPLVEKTTLRDLNMELDEALRRIATEQEEIDKLNILKAEIITALNIVG